MNILKTIAAKVLGRKFTDNMENIQKEKTMKRRNHPVRWWDLECEEIIKRRKEKLNTWKKTQSLSDFIEYKRNIAEGKKKEEASVSTTFIIV